MADPDLQIKGKGGGRVGGGWGEGGGHPDPEIRGAGGGGLKKIFFWPFGPQFGLILPWIRHWS